MLILSKHIVWDDIDRMTQCTEWQKFILLIFIALALCIYVILSKNNHAWEDIDRKTECAERQKDEKLSLFLRGSGTCAEGVGTTYALALCLYVILSKNDHVWENIDRKTECAEWQKFILLIFIALALCLYVILSKNNRAWEDIDRKTECAE